MISREDMQIVLEAARAVLQNSDFKTAARVIFDCACRLTGARSGYVALLNEAGDENEVLFLDAGGLPCTVNPDLPMPIRGLRERAYRTGQAVFENDFFRSEWAQFLPQGHVHLANVLFAPLVIEGRTVGVMGLANKEGQFVATDALLASTLGEYAAMALQNSQNLERLQETVADLQVALREVKTLQGIIPICASCKKIRDEQGYWQAVEQYISDRSSALFSHGLCDSCAKLLYPKEMDPS